MLTIQTRREQIDKAKSIPTQNNTHTHTQKWMMFIDRIMNEKFNGFRQDYDYLRKDESDTMEDRKKARERKKTRSDTFRHQ